MIYRTIIRNKNLTPHEIKIKESNLLIFAQGPIKQKAKKFLKQARQQIEHYIDTNPAFGTSFKPLKIDKYAPVIVKSMFKAAKSANVGPMASVAGAIAEYIGKKLLREQKEIIVENGGDIFLKTNRYRLVAIYAGKSPLSQKIAIKIPPSARPYGICTSSGTIGHSFSYGRADAVVILSRSCPFSDAWATRIGNMVKEEQDITKLIKLIQTKTRILGGLIIKKSKLVIAGQIVVEKI